MKKVKVGEFLNKHKLVDKEIIVLDYHLNILNYPLEDLVYRLIREGYIKKDNNTSEENLAKSIYDLIIRTNADSKDYNNKIDEFLTNIGLRLSRIGSSISHKKWNACGLIDDDGFGFGTEPSSINDNEVDFINDRIHKMK